jgi:hypothetical protein
MDTMSARRTPQEISKVSYTPIEAAARWAGLLRHEEEIRLRLGDRLLPAADEFLQWPEFRLKAALLYDAIVHGELACEIDGVRSEDVTGVSENLRLRHVDLRTWFTRYYPSDRPAFLFTESERQAHPTITLDAINAFVFEREALKLELANYRRKLETLRAKSKETSTRCDATGTAADTGADALTDLRNETTYLHIVGGLLTLLLGHAPSGKPYSSFTTQAAIIDALVAQHGGRLGITERTLQSRFAEAKRRLSST